MTSEVLMGGAALRLPVEPLSPGRGLLEAWGRECSVRAALAIVRRALRRGAFSGEAAAARVVREWASGPDAPLASSVLAGPAPEASWARWLLQCATARCSPGRNARVIAASALHRGLAADELCEAVRTEVGAWARGQPDPWREER